jgi:hypothetical protein
MRNLEAPLELHQGILGIALVEPQASGLPLTDATVAQHECIVPHTRHLKHLDRDEYSIGWMSHQDGDDA